MPIRGSPNGAGYLRPQAGRDRPESVVAINRNAWSQAIGMAGRNRPVRARCRRAIVSRCSSILTKCRSSAQTHSRRYSARHENSPPFLLPLINSPRSSPIGCGQLLSVTPARWWCFASAPRMRRCLRRSLRSARSTLALSSRQRTGRLLPETLPRRSRLRRGCAAALNATMCLSSQRGSSSMERPRSFASRAASASAVPAARSSGNVKSDSRGCNLAHNSKSATSSGCYC
jgi:hypothetical protein